MPDFRLQANIRPMLSTTQTAYAGQTRPETGQRRASRHYPGFNRPAFNPYLLVLLQRLLAQLYGVPPINRQGSDGNDQLIGGYGNDRLDGRGGDDLLAGRAGNDFLAGGAGNDHLYGGIGNDYMQAGAGNDLLFDGIGQDLADGGDGEDRLALPGRYNDYLIRHSPAILAPYPFGRPEQFEFIDPLRGNRLQARNIEHFRFADEALTVDQLRQRLSPVTAPPLPLNTQQRDQIIRLFGFVPGQTPVSGTKVVDRDGTGQLSAGDIAIIYGGITGGELQRKVLTPADVAFINAGGNDDIASQLASHRSQWESLGIDDYRFRLQRSQFGPADGNRPVDIEVRNGQVVNATWADTGETLPDLFNYNRMTVPDLFDLIDNAIQQNAEHIDVDWDPATGIPRNLFIDQSSQIADEEIGITATNFEALNATQPGVVVHAPRNVVGFGDRMPRITPPNQPVTPRDYVLLGDSNSYPANAVSVTIGNSTVPVVRQNGQFVARGFEFPHAGPVNGTLKLEDGSIVPLKIRVTFAY